jgi:hypothetical protein
MRQEEKEIRSISDLIAKLDAHILAGEKIWFRGQAATAWNLTPSISRTETNPIAKEWNYLKLFKQNATRFVPESSAKTKWEWLLLMQHYKVPTRLLDWSENPLVSLYFAVENEPDQDGALWMLNPIEYNQHNNLTIGDIPDLPSLDMDEFIDSYLPNKIISSPGAVVPIACIAARNSSRIVAKHGVFTLFGNQFESLDTFAPPNGWWRYKIPKAEKSQIKKELKTLGFTAFTLFQEIGNVHDTLKELGQ